MAKAFIELRSKQRKYKLNADDISKVYKIQKRRGPNIPSFNDIQKVLPETDDDTEFSTTLSL